jgi:hypothetical protein
MKTVVLAALGAVMMAMPATAQPANSCFYMRDFQNWKAPDTKTIYIRVNTDRFYRLDLAAECSMLRQPGIHLITKTRGSDNVCDALDWDLSVSDSTGFNRMGGARQACIVKKMTPLSDADVTAIPKGFKP